MTYANYLIEASKPSVLVGGPEAEVFDRMLVKIADSRGGSITGFKARLAAPTIGGENQAFGLWFTTRVTPPGLFVVDNCDISDVITIRTTGFWQGDTACSELGWSASLIFKNFIGRRCADNVLDLKSYLRVERVTGYDCRGVLKSWEGGDRAVSIIRHFNPTQYGDYAPVTLELMPASDGRIGPRKFRVGLFQVSGKLPANYKAIIVSGCHVDITLDGVKVDVDIRKLVHGNDGGTWTLTVAGVRVQ